MRRKLISYTLLTSCLISMTAIKPSYALDDDERMTGKRARSTEETLKADEKRPKKKRKTSVTLHDLSERDGVTSIINLKELEEADQFFCKTDTKINLLPAFFEKLFISKRKSTLRQESWKELSGLSISAMKIIQKVSDIDVRKSLQSLFSDFFEKHTQLLNTARMTNEVNQQRYATESLFLDRVDFLKLVYLSQLNLTNQDSVKGCSQILDDVQNHYNRIRYFRDNGLRSFHKDLMGFSKNLLNSAKTILSCISDLTPEHQKIFLRFYKLMTLELFPETLEKDYKKTFRDLAQYADFEPKTRMDIQTSKPFNLLRYMPMWFSLRLQFRQNEDVLENMELWLDSFYEHDEEKNYDFFIRELHAFESGIEWKKMFLSSLSQDKDKNEIPEEETINIHGQIYHLPKKGKEEALKLRRSYLTARANGEEEAFKEDLSDENKTYLTIWEKLAKLYPMDQKNLRNATRKELQSVENILNVLIDYGQKGSSLEQITNKTLTLLKNNTEICTYLYNSQASEAVNYHPKYHTILLHPEQSDANLEMRVWGFYQTLTSIFNDLNSREHAKNWIVELSQTCGKGLCLEAWYKSLDSAYQNLKKSKFPIQNILEDPNIEITESKQKILERFCQIVLNKNSSEVEKLKQKKHNLVRLRQTLERMYFLNFEDRENLLKDSFLLIVRGLKKDKEAVLTRRDNVLASELLLGLFNRQFRDIKAKSSSFFCSDQPIPDMESAFSMLPDGLKEDFPRDIEKLTQDIKNLELSTQDEVVKGLTSLLGRKAADGEFTREFLQSYLENTLCYEGVKI